MCLHVNLCVKKFMPADRQFWFCRGVSNSSLGAGACVGISAIAVGVGGAESLGAEPFLKCQILSLYQ